MTTPRRTPLDPWTATRLGAAGPLDRAELERLQLERLRAAVARAARQSPLYRARLAGVDPGALRTRADLATLPFTTPQDVRVHGAQLVAVSQDEVARVVTLPTSGTTGAPKRVWFSAGDQESTVDFFAHGMSTLVGRGDRVLVLLPGPRPGSVGALLAAGLARLGADPIVHGDIVDLPAAAEVLRREAPTSVVGAPVQILGLQRWSEEIGRVRWRPRTALLTTDHVPRALTRRLEETCGCEVFEHYGMTEMGLGAAVECEAHAGYHLRAPDLLFEIVDPASGAALPDGELGEVVFTTLSPRAMPLVRYRTGDRSRLLPGRCPCGTALPRLERVRGRIGERTVDSGSHGVVTLADLDEVLFAVRPLVDYAAATGGTPGEPARLEVAARCLGDLASARAAIEDALGSIPALRAASADGRLSVSVATQELGPRPWPALAKRVLAALPPAPATACAGAG